MKVFIWIYLTLVPATLVLPALTTALPSNPDSLHSIAVRAYRVCDPVNDPSSCRSS